MKHSRGFTLVEIAIVMGIIALMAGAILGGVTIVRAAGVADAITTVQDLRAASAAFRDRFHYYPGDFPVTTELPGIGAGCAAGGNGDGAISAAESACVMEHLVLAGLIRSPTTPMRLARFNSVVRIVSRAVSTVPIPAGRQSSINVIEIATLPCDAAQEIDLKLDDGNLGTGQVLGFNATCTPGGANDPLSLMAFSI